MKHKKLASLLLALVMVLAWGGRTIAFAAQEGEKDGGSITIDNAVTGCTYRVYQILYLESYDAAANAYSYKANSAWESWLKTQTDYVGIDTQGYVTWVDGASVADFAKAALAYAKEHNIASDPEAVTASGTEVKFENLKLGYYLVDSSLGTLCSLDTTNPTVIIKEKNGVPTNEKLVEEDSNSAWGSTNDADIGQTVNFQSTITAQAGAESYVFHDEMSAGLTYTGVTGITLNGTPVDTENYEVETSELGDKCTFHVVFTQAFCDTLKANDKIVISYTATVNENAVVAGGGNGNESYLTYGEKGETDPSTTTTYTWYFGVFKFYWGTYHEVEIEDPLSLQRSNDVTDKTEMALSGAKFTLSRDSNGTDCIKLIALGEENEGADYYRVAKEGEADAKPEIITSDNGCFYIRGLDSGTYYLNETAAPAGYNQLSGPIEVEISNTGVVKYKMSGDTEYQTFDGAEAPIIRVENNTGVLLPSTGGMGTTIFYVAGSILLLGAAVLLITRKRMRVEK